MLSPPSRNGGFMPTLGAPALQAYSTRIFQACKAPADDAATVSDHLVTANLMGFDSHGVIRIPEYLAMCGRV